MNLSRVKKIEYDRPSFEICEETEQLFELMKNESCWEAEGELEIEIESLEEILEEKEYGADITNGIIERLKEDIKAEEENGNDIITYRFL
jgi:translation initiation factor 2B subunit (eIF-2B alpha/beta/delta family)